MTKTINMATNETWFKTGYSNSIEEVTVIKETEKQVTFRYKSHGGKELIGRSNKRGSYANFFKTFEEARQFLIDTSESKVWQKENELQYAKDQHQKLLEKYPND